LLLLYRLPDGPADAARATEVPSDSTELARMSKRPLYIAVNHNLGASRSHAALEYTRLAQADALDRLSELRTIQNKMRLKLILAAALAITLLYLCFT
jgi:hypothetical protein